MVPVATVNAVANPRWHTVEFRQSEQYGNWRALLHHSYDPSPVVEQYQNVPRAVGPCFALRNNRCCGGLERSGLHIVEKTRALEFPGPAVPAFYP